MQLVTKLLAKQIIMILIFILFVLVSNTTEIMLTC